MMSKSTTVGSETAMTPVPFHRSKTVRNVNRRDCPTTTWMTASFPRNGSIRPAVGGVLGGSLVSQRSSRASPSAGRGSRIGTFGSRTGCGKEAVGPGVVPGAIERTLSWASADRPSSSSHAAIRQASVRKPRAAFTEGNRKIVLVRKLRSIVCLVKSERIVWTVGASGIHPERFQLFTVRWYSLTRLPRFSERNRQPAASAAGGYSFQTIQPVQSLQSENDAFETYRTASSLRRHSFDNDQLRT
jgi:hypothetical protein